MGADGPPTVWVKRGGRECFRGDGVQHRDSLGQSVLAGLQLSLLLLEDKQLRYGLVLGEEEHPLLKNFA